MAKVTTAAINKQQQMLQICRGRQTFCTVGESLGQSSHLVSVLVPQKTEIRTTMRPNYAVTLAHPDGELY